MPPVRSRTRAGCLGLCPTTAWKPPGRETGSIHPPLANFLHVRAIYNTPENHESITAATKETISHQLTQLSFAIAHFSSLFFTYLPQIPCSSISFLSTNALPIFLKTPTTPNAGILQLVFIHPGTLWCLLSGNAKLLSLQRGAPAEPMRWTLPPGSGAKALPDKGRRKQRAEETPARHLRSANNFQPLENLRGGLGSFLLPRACSALPSACRWWKHCWRRWRVVERRF